MSKIDHVYQQQLWLFGHTDQRYHASNPIYTEELGLRDTTFISIAVECVSGCCIQCAERSIDWLANWAEWIDNWIRMDRRASCIALGTMWVCAYQDEWHVNVVAHWLAVWPVPHLTIQLHSNKFRVWGQKLSIRHYTLQTVGWRIAKSQFCPDLRYKRAPCACPVCVLCVCEPEHGPSLHMILCNERRHINCHICRSIVSVCLSVCVYGASVYYNGMIHATISWRWARQDRHCGMTERNHSIQKLIWN